MMRRMIVPLLFGLIGAGILISLGVWQVQRMQWKEGILADITARIAAAPVPLPAAPDPKDEHNRYLPVTVSGHFTGNALSVLVSRKEIGAGVRIIEAFQTEDGRRVLVDRGFLRDEDKNRALSVTTATITGNLHWPQETDSFTPPPDAKTGLWYARDVPAMAQALDTEPTFIVAREPTGDGIEAMPVDTSGIPNDHWGYAVQWFSLAAVWLGMTAYLLWRIRQRTV
ncbi:MAG: cytochrome oxidase biogenesis protein Surf1, facilitates heme A insertion [Rhodobacteraceae bacterium PARR1]|nr:MAG: cytochrome oxidase biogenesis protein Surf1, facilitates heme A insertion [Rhodobacteraceae bacterium PARR1]